MSERLISLIDGDLPGHRLTREGGRAVFIPKSGGPVLEVGVKIEKRFLGRTEIAQFRTVMSAPNWGRGALSVSHTGRLRRAGIGFRIDEGSETATKLAEMLGDDPGFTESVMTLDFTRFDIGLDGEDCEVAVELMGGSLVSIALPPIRSYVRLHDDQREALIGSLDALARVLSGKPRS